jgi:chromosome segregation ATPase
MIDQSILDRWLNERSDIALQKLLRQEPLTFEDNIVFAVVGLREEMRRMEKRIDDRFTLQDERFERNETSIREVKQEIVELRKEMGELRKEIMSLRQDITTLTRWILTVLIAVPVFMKLLDVLLARMKFL